MSITPDEQKRVEARRAVVELTSQLEQKAKEFAEIRNKLTADYNCNVIANFPVSIKNDKERVSVNIHVTMQDNIK